MNDSGKLHLILGPMYSGKSSNLIRKLLRFESIGKKIYCINSIKDIRTPNNEIKTHDNITIPSCKVNYLSEVYIPYDVKVLGIDEAQFFPDLLNFVKEKLKQKYIIIIAGLDADYKQEPFGDILKLIPISDSYEKLYAYCKMCKDETKAPFTKRIINSQQQILVGANNEYMAVCRDHL